ncbi:MAG: hypothetical protein WC071_07305 [Victivallaceae bacterium]
MTNRKLKQIVLAGCCLIFSGSLFGGLLDLKDRMDISDLKNAKADSWSIVGDNIIVKGNVFIPYKNITIYGDQAIINTESKDIEASGNIRVFRRRVSETTLTIDELDRMRAMPDVFVKINGYVVDPLGNQRIKVTVYNKGDMMKASSISGNLASGMLEFKDLECVFKTFVCKAKSGIRKPGGEIEVKDVDITSCNYAINDNGHYSISCASAKIYPHETNIGVSGYNPDPGDHSIWGYDCKLKVYGVPVLWLPMFYKPKDESPGLFKVRGGKTSDWGYFLSLSKRFDITDDPYSTVKVMADYYSLRGFGYGADVDVRNEFSKTRIFGYSIYDIRPYESNDIENTGRLTIPNFRYDFKISNVTHITPRLDFRGHFEVLSDAYFLNDYFNNDFNNNPQPVTFGATEYQFDRFSTALYIRPRVNNFFTAVERLPEFRIDVPRQELFSNIYYQGETSVDYLQMKWIDFDKPRTAGNKVDPTNYDSFRFDTLHMFYYPLKLDWLNLIPRAGVRMTYYNKSSKTKVDENDLNTMFAVAQPESNAPGNVINYDDKGGNKFRFVGEFGLEANTKIYSSWQSVKNAYWQLDGLRHVAEPYVNYTYIPEPTEDRDYLYYFDDIDRIDEQNFARLGLRNRIQTRRGDYGSEKIYNWFTMENYWDYHMVKTNGFNNVGDIGTKMAFMPYEGFSINTLFSIDAGNNNAHDTDVIRNGRSAGRPGLNLDWLNKWEIGVAYKIIEDVNVNLAYVYQDPYKTQSAYSMGSTLTDIDSGSAFDKVYTQMIQNIRLGIDFPLTPDRKARASYQIYYDFDAGYIREQSIKLIKTIHCWEVALEASETRSNDSDGDRNIEHSFMITLYLTGMVSPLQQVQRSGMKTFNNSQQGGI